MFITNSIYRNLGTNHPSNTVAPLNTTLVLLNFFKIFLENIFSYAVFIIASLSCVLIYSLMLSDVEEKTYQFGMLRALGFPK